MTAAWIPARFGSLVSALDDDTITTTADLDTVVDAIERHLTVATAWLASSVITGHLPTAREVRNSYRSMRLLGVRPVVENLVTRARGGLALRRPNDVEVVRNAVVVDVRHTAETELATGIQRVARETIKRWYADHDNVVFVTWADDRRSLRRLTRSEHERALFGTHAKSRDRGLSRKPIVVPWGGHFLLPELAAEPWRTERIGAMATYSNANTGVIGFDCVPLTTVETVADGMASHFAWNLGAVAKMGRIATISDAAAVEYRGWRRMLAVTGEPGPEIATVFLPSDAETASDAAVTELKDLIEYEEGEPLVIVVGSHEPRKNHLTVLHAAEELWTSGRRFRMVFIGGNSWNSRAFLLQVDRLKRAGWPLVSLSGLADNLLWAAYRLARFSVFPSVNEGFGLPVGESLATGTPVVTSNYGSMREIAEKGGGAVLVDPYNDESVAAGVRSLVDDDDLLERLRAEAALRPTRSWDQYSTELWAYLVDENVDAGAPAL